MSHREERKATNCLNCNAQVYGRFCHICGQENVEPKETVWHMVSHFFQDITHFDGKFFSSLKLLLLKPGYLSAEYVRGRKASYLNPVRMYVFTSAFFFLVFFSQVHFDNVRLDNSIGINGKPLNDIRAMDPASFQQFTASLTGGTPMSRSQFERYVDSIKTGGGIHFMSNTYRSKGQYDSALASGTKRHNWLVRQLTYKEIEINGKYGNNMGQALSSLFNSFTHRFPQLFFISLPLFALLLKLLYSRRKQFYYVSHAIFSIHLYIFVFIAMLAMVGINAAEKGLHAKWLGYLNIGIYFTLFFYEYKAMRNFYGQGRGKTILKFVLLNLLSVGMIAILFAIFLLFSFMEI